MQSIGKFAFVLATAGIILGGLMAPHTLRAQFEINTEEEANGPGAATSGSDTLNLPELEAKLAKLADSMRTAIPMELRFEFGLEFARTLLGALNKEGATRYPFETLGSKIHIHQSPDGQFRLFNWLVAPGNHIKRYYGLIQTKQGDVFPLTNVSERVESDYFRKTADPQNWYGAEYYRILESETGGLKYYILFGLNTHGVYSNKKLLDVLYFEEGKPFFGLPVFQLGNHAQRISGMQTRVLWEYKKDALFHLNYDPGLKMIVFDRLVSLVNDPNRKNTFGPSGQTQGLRRESNGTWSFVPEAIPVLKLKDGAAPIDGVMPKLN